MGAYIILPCESVIACNLVNLIKAKPAEWSVPSAGVIDTRFEGIRVSNRCVLRTPPVSALTGFWALIQQYTIVLEQGNERLFWRPRFSLTYHAHQKIFYLVRVEANVQIRPVECSNHQV
jgi:hypothetical protein